MSNENSKLDYESGVTPYLMAAITDSGDHKTFTTLATYFSESEGNAPDIKPNGVLTGGAVIPAVSGSNDVIDTAALTCNLNGVVTSVSPNLDVSITRPATDVAKVNSVTINSSGAIAVVAGTDGGSTTFSETRGAAGGPPLIPTDSIELAQVRLTASSAAAITAAEIYQVIGTHMETADYPPYEADNFTATVVFDSALPLIHTGPVAKAVFASYADPVFSEQRHANDFVPADLSHSVSSEQVYNATVSTSSSSLGQASFTAILKDGITDPIVGKANQTLFFRYYQDRFKAPFVLTQGKLGIGRTFGASDNPRVSCTVSAATESVNNAS